jgi:AraC-like DNA-binding protein
MDALSEILRLAEFGAEVVIDATAQEPWCVSVPASPAQPRAYLVVEGECTLHASGLPEAIMRAGDFVFLPQGQAHLLGSPVTSEARALSALVRPSVDGELLPARLGGSGATTRWIGFSSHCERHLAQALLDSLPPIVFVDMAGAPAVDWLIDTLGLSLSSSEAPNVGASATRGRLGEVVFIEALARHIHSLPRGGKGWLAGLNDRYVGRALSLVHGRPSESWTVERLGRQVGLGRSALAERFSLVMGEPIFSFLTRWRLQLAAEYLLTTPRSIQSIAKEAGYESAGAFSAAFKRTFRKPPSKWRKQKRHA